MEIIETSNAYQSKRPLPQAVICDDYVFLSGSAGFHPETEELVSDGLDQQVAMTFKNIQTVLSECDLELSDIVKINAYLTNADSMDDFDEAYKNALSEPYPARTTVVTDLVFDGKIEIDAIAKR
ncbi:RidA family protein [Natrialba sp. INN-245]|uniref:RidA family protein n=1 Tax=Natrialba sp. INN-245 TaxID=2690967 RepID=UPI001312B1C7|nr:RidA family protein [Natrialba sp. INN-245]MWV40673.1 RutC protein [Natrialba sp. INN-245]